jgi:metal transporter CNNM
VTISSDTVVDRKVFDTLLSSGYSRFPVTDANKPNTVLGLLLIKKLLKYDPATNKTVSQLPLSILPEARPTINCFQALDYFQTGRSHLLLLTENPGKPSNQHPAGVVTLEGLSHLLCLPTGLLTQYPSRCHRRDYRGRNR